MPDLLELEVATPEKLLVRETVEEVQLPEKNGYMGVLPGHAALLGQLDTGFISYSARGRTKYISVQGGFIEVLPDHVRVLANTAVRAEDIDVASAHEDLQRAQEQIVNPALGVDPAAALEALAWAQARVDAAQRR